MDQIREQLSRINDKLDAVHKDVQQQLTVIGREQTAQGSQLAEHMRRTELAEKSIQLLQKSSSDHHAEIVSLRVADSGRKLNMDRFLKVVLAILTAAIIKLLIH